MTLPYDFITTVYTTLMGGPPSTPHRQARKVPPQHGSSDNRDRSAGTDSNHGEGPDTQQSQQSQQLIEGNVQNATDQQAVDQNIGSRHRRSGQTPSLIASQQQRGLATEFVSIEQQQSVHASLNTRATHQQFSSSTTTSTSTHGSENCFYRQMHKSNSISAFVSFGFQAASSFLSKFHGKSFRNRQNHSWDRFCRLVFTMIPP